MTFKIKDSPSDWIYKIRLDDPAKRKENLKLFFSRFPNMKLWYSSLEEYPISDKIAICAIIKDEQLYLEEWIQYYLSIGFTDIFLYEDDGSLSHKEITDKYSLVHLSLFNKLDVNDIGDVQTCKKLVLLFEWFCKEYLGKLDWCLFVDPDEYLCFSDGISLKDICIENCRGIKIPWKIYGCSGHITKPTTNTLESYTIESDTPEKNGKVFVNMRYKEYFWENVHRLLFSKSLDNKLEYGHIQNTDCWINHYITRSWEEWVTLITKRGDVTLYKPRTLWQFFRYNKELKGLALKLIDAVNISQLLRGFPERYDFKHFKWVEMDDKYIYDLFTNDMKASRAIVPILTDLINPKSVIDLGCGTCTFLREFLDLGIKDIHGVDKSNLELENPYIDSSYIEQFDLNNQYTANRRYDLAISLEVGEHLKNPDNLVKSLASLSDVILFSAAIPKQVGLGHINCLWQSYWEEKFKQQGYIAVDIIRPLIWNNKDLYFWYKLNTILYVREESSFLNQLSNNIKMPVMDIVHPDLYLLLK